MRCLTAILMTIAIASGTADAFAQQPTPATSPLHPARVVWSDAGVPAASPSVQRSDSVKNGAIAGAVVGGAAMAAFMTFLIHNVGCVAEDTPCGREVAIASLMTAGAAGAGALIGAGIDRAVNDQQPMAPARPGVSPMLSPKRAGIRIGIRW